MKRWTGSPRTLYCVPSVRSNGCVLGEGLQTFLPICCHAIRWGWSGKCYALSSFHITELMVQRCVVAMKLFNNINLNTSPYTPCSIIRIAYKVISIQKPTTSFPFSVQQDTTPVLLSPEYNERNWQISLHVSVLLCESVSRASITSQLHTRIDSVDERMNGGEVIMLAMNFSRGHF